MTDIYEDSKVDKALNFISMFKSFDEMKSFYDLNRSEFSELKQRARFRYGDNVFSS